ncbi:MAG: hypothetical protein WAK01_12755 [Methylocystis sp.]
MRCIRGAFATLVALAFVFSAEAREENPVIESLNAYVAEPSGYEALSGQNEIAENLPDCQKVDVDIDEGYGVTGHVTRDECPPRRR